MACENLREIVEIEKKTCREPLLIIKIDGIDFLVTGHKIERVICFDDVCPMFFDEPSGELSGQVPCFDQLWSPPPAILVPCFDEGYCFDDIGLNFDEVFCEPEYVDLLDFAGTTQTINQKLDPDKGTVNSISGFKLRIVDIDNLASALYSRGFVVKDLLSRRFEVFLSDASRTDDFPSEWKKLFAGIATTLSSGPGYLDVQLDHPDKKKQQKIYEEVKTELTAPFSDTDTSFFIAVPEDNSEVLLPGDCFRTAFRINDEIVEYTTYDDVTGEVSGLTRNKAEFIDFCQDFAGAANHDEGDAVESIWILEGNTVELALKLMLSDGDGTAFFSGTPTQFVAPSTICVAGDVVSFNNFTAGDIVTLTGTGGNDGTYTIDSVVYNSGADKTEFTVDELTILSLPGAGTIDVTSQYNVLPVGLGMDPVDVDIDRHLDIQGVFLPSAFVKFFIREDFDGKEFIEKQLYFPFGAYAVPRDAQSSINFSTRPLPTSPVAQIDKNCILDCDSIRINRSLNRNFFNQVIYRFDQSPCDDVYFSGNLAIDTDSIDCFDRRQTLTITSNGMRADLGSDITSRIAATRLLDRYKLAAEYIDGLQVTYGVGCAVQIGDFIEIDMTDLNVTNSLTGERDLGVRTWLIVNKSFNFKTGAAKLNLLGLSDVDDDPASGSFCRFGVISPTSCINYTAFEVNDLTLFTDEGEKWCAGDIVKIRNEDCTYMQSNVTISEVNGDIVSFENDLVAHTVTEKLIMEHEDYDNVQECAKEFFVFLSDDVNNFGDGGTPYGIY